MCEKDSIEGNGRKIFKLLDMRNSIKFNDDTVDDIGNFIGEYDIKEFK